MKQVCGPILAAMATKACWLNCVCLLVFISITGITYHLCTEPQSEAVKCCCIAIALLTFASITLYAICNYRHQSSSHWPIAYLALFSGSFTTTALLIAATHCIAQIATVKDHTATTLALACLLILSCVFMVLVQLITVTFLVVCSRQDEKCASEFSILAPDYCDSLDKELLTVYISQKH